jgi:Domain of unknown function (DUF4276)
MSARWVELHLLVEGHTEFTFANQTLKPHLNKLRISVKPIVLATNRKLDARGGVVRFAQVQRDLQLLLRQHRDGLHYFSTMLDLYALPNDFPQWQAAQAKQARTKVEMLERALKDEIGDHRFHPHLQLHEFEALLFCDLAELGRRLADSDKGIRSLEQSVSSLAPEDINDGATTAPSKRIITHVPAYQRAKVRVGAAAAAAIGLPALRARCPHFDGWIRTLESLAPSGEATGAAI